VAILPVVLRPRTKFQFNGQVSGKTAEIVAK
jgi:hypothetical protein